MRVFLLWSSLCLLPACVQEVKDEADSATPDSGSDLDSADSGDSGGGGGGSDVDADDDGWPESVDCDDTDPYVHPNADEYCDGIDNDCDGATDEQANHVYYTDADLDGWGDPWTATAGCLPGAGYTTVGGDCDDTDNDVNPDAVEVCDTVDNDCDGDVDEGVEPGVWYLDADTDGYGTPASAEVSCEPSAGYVANATDCDDARADVYPGAAETCNGVDDDCDGVVDDEAADGTTWYPDDDRDGYGDPEGAAVIACTQPGGYVGDATDCNDASSTAHPGARELCDEIDNDCDSDVDEDAVDALVWRLDRDGDGFGDPTTAGVVSCDPGSGYVDDDSDCNDYSAAVNPAAAEVCNGIDDNCDGDVDTTSIIGTFYYDHDGDGYGDPEIYVVSCEAPAGYVVDGDDCDDNDASIYPTAPDTAGDGIDSNCDGASELDFDGDGFDAEELGGTDCDDTRSDVYPGAPDVPYDGFDADCSGGSDYDADGDGYVSDGYGGDDCDDSDATVYPTAPETDPMVDHDCDGVLEYGPTAVADYDAAASTLSTCSTIVLDASGSSDRESSVLTYAWEVVSVPDFSSITTPDLVEETDESPSLFVDAAGDYTFSLQVVDEDGNHSALDEVTVTIAQRTTNNTPVANGGADQSSSASIDCTPISYGAGGYDCDECAAVTFTLDGSASSDADGEPLTYRWSVYSGDGRLLTASDGETATVEVGSVAPTYGATASETVTVRLEVTDCYGATSAPDPIRLTSSCTGY